jgi:3-isopropylmalate/(R)-2-methylmalate dehydratase small subunit
MSRAFTTVTGVVAPFVTDDVNTDLIIPIKHCVSTAQENLGTYAFEAIRYQSDGTENPHFVFNRTHYRGAPILLAGANFGCGSSREPAVWALDGMGVRVIIARSFGSIFYANCLRNGLLPVTLPAEAHSRLVQLGSGEQPLTLTVDLQACAVILPDGEMLTFEIEPARRRALLEGLDEIGQTLLSMPDIIAFQELDRKRRPWVWESLQATPGIEDTKQAPS